MPTLVLGRFTSLEILRFLVLRCFQSQLHVPSKTAVETGCYLEPFYFFCLVINLVATVCRIKISLFTLISHKAACLSV